MVGELSDVGVVIVLLVMMVVVNYDDHIMRTSIKL